MALISTSFTTCISLMEIGLLATTPFGARRESFGDDVIKSRLCL